MNGVFITSLTALVALSGSAARTGYQNKDDAWEKIAPLFKPPNAYKNDFGSYPSVLRFRDGRPVRTTSDWKRRRKELKKEWTELLGRWPPLIAKPRITLQIGRAHV